MMQRSTGPDPAYTAPFHITQGHRQDVLVVCDHASRAIPPELGDLGLGPDHLRDHIAWDPGAARVAAALARALDCPAIFGGSSRLVVDLNRAPLSSHLILERSDGVEVPGNQGLGRPERARRAQAWFTPYHAAIDTHLDRVLKAGLRPTLVSVHSFTPHMAGEVRPWPLGLMWQRHEEWIPRLLAWFRDRAVDIGDNQPYDGRQTLGYTLEHHGIRRDLPHVLFELRQDELLLDQQQTRWGELLAEALLETGVIGAPTHA